MKKATKPFVPINKNFANYPFARGANFPSLRPDGPYPTRTRLVGDTRDIVWEMHPDSKGQPRVGVCKTHADRQGWEVGEVYKDKAISGSQSNRPEYQRMLADAEAKAFDVLLVYNLSRLARDDIETKKTLRWFKHWGRRLIGVDDGIDSNSKGYKLQAGFRSLQNEDFLDSLSTRVYDSHKSYAKAGKHTGGRTYGYRHVPDYHPTRKDSYGGPLIQSVHLEIDPEQAKIVRDIFRLFAEGRGYRQIADILNGRGIKAPRKQNWGGSTIRPMLKNARYVGIFEWGRREWVRHPETHKRQPRMRPEGETSTTLLPELRLVEQQLWEKVQARRAEKLAEHKAAQKKGKRVVGKTPQHLLSGLVFCGECGGRYIVANRTHYRCSQYMNRGEHVCTNSISVRRDVIEPTLLHAIKTELFDGATFADFQTETRRVLTERLKARNKDAGRLKRDLAAVEDQLKNMVNFVKAGTITPTLAEELRKAEAEKKKLTAALDAEIPQIESIEDLLRNALDRFGSMALNLEAFAARDVTKARHMIKALVGGPIRLIPTKGGGLNAEMQASYDGLITLIEESPGGKARASKLRVVAGTRNPRESLVVPVEL